MQSHRLHEDSSFESHYHRVFASVLYSPVLFRIVQDILLFTYDLLCGAESRLTDANSNIIEQGVQYVEKHYHRPDLNLPQVAWQVGRNPSYFSHLLTTRKGITFRELVTEIRIRHACRLLKETTLSIQEIGNRVGYKNTNYFSRVFKRTKGCSPGSTAIKRNERKTK